MITISKLSKSFGQKHVLNNISLEIKKGEIFGLVGINGAGKTTLIKSLLHLLRIDTGEILIAGNPNNSIDAKRAFYYLPEKFTPSPQLKGREFLALSLAYYGVKFNRTRAEEEAIKLDLDPQVLDISVRKYSKGMGQKLGLIATFMADLPLLILDEPMSGLDPIARIRVKNRIMEYNAAGNTVFFSSHILADIDEICDRIGILHNANMHFIGTASEFKQNHNSLEHAFLEMVG